MKLTAERVFAALPVIDRIIAEKRPLTIKGAYRMARLHTKLVPELRIIEERRDALIQTYDYKALPANAKKGDEPVPTVPTDREPEFFAQWAEILREEIEVNIEPIPLAYLGPADAESPVTAQEMMMLGELLVDDSDQPPATAAAPAPPALPKAA